MNTLSLSTIHHMIIGVLLMMIMAVASVFALSTNNTLVSLAIVNSYSGSWSLSSSGTTAVVSGVLWSSSPQVALDLLSNTSVTYQLSGTDGPGLGTGSFTNNLTLPRVLSGDGYVNVVDGMLTQGSEPLSLPQLRVGLDQTAPTQPILTGIVNNSVIGSGIDLAFSWNAVVDSGAGIVGYQVYIGLVPNLGYMVSYLTTSTSLLLLSSDVPYGTLYRSVVAIDHVGNRSDAMMGYFHHGYQTVFDPGAGYSPSSIDGTVNNDSVSQQTLSLWNPYSTAEQDGRSRPDTQSDSTTTQSNPTVGNPVYRVDPVSGVSRVVGIDCGYEDARRLLDAKCREWDKDIIQGLDAVSVGIVLPSLGEEDVGPGDDARSDTDVGLFLARPGDIIVGRFASNPVDGWLLPQGQNTDIGLSYCSQYNSCQQEELHGAPDYQDYERVLRQYHQNYIPRTREFSWYIVTMTIGLLWFTRWFFRGGYHHRYMIKYFK